jgi:hypothetical protein
MTDYYPVTKEELEQIWRNCKHPEWDNREGYPCEGCEYEPLRGVRCTQKIRELKESVLSRPDPLALLEAWTQNEFKKICHYDGREEVIDFLKNLVYYQQEIINQLRTKPEAVRQQGIKEGWLP